MMFKDVAHTLDETIDTMAIMMAGFALDQAEQQLRAIGKDDLADALQKLQIDTGIQHEAIAKENYANVENNLVDDETLVTIEMFEPVTHDRLKMLDVVCALLPDGATKDDVRALGDELAQVVILPAASGPVPTP
ncbi:hypothetical protein [Micavibrio aeruginosavorus]|uniref:hypothetical protein n=1 Tax=Micavibrio aeruginosavorus TaxID=349221 RepID=UPI003F4AA0AD